MTDNTKNKNLEESKPAEETKIELTDENAEEISGGFSVDYYKSIIKTKSNK